MLLLQYSIINENVFSSNISLFRFFQKNIFGQQIYALLLGSQRTCATCTLGKALMINNDFGKGNAVSGDVCGWSCWRVNKGADISLNTDIGASSHQRMLLLT